ncbi:hypothetical protein FA15DRAFT_583587, partial [Coprinopsis marcescibilis]
TNSQNDALLHKLVHTTLLSGSLAPELNMSSGQRRKAMAGRLMELVGDVKLGKGERHLRKEEHNRAAKNVRDGIAQKQRERQKQELESAKNLGNYHPALKGLFEDDSSSSTPKPRTRGLKMGVGKFKGGVLTLSKDEIEKVNGPASRQSNRGHPYRRR